MQLPGPSPFRLDPKDLARVDRAIRKTQTKSQILDGLTWGRLFGGAFTQTLPQGVVGFFAAGQQADVGLRGSILVQINPGATGSGPQANLPVYIRTVANASYPGTSVGDFEANPDAGPTTTGTATAGTASLTVASATNIAVGQMVTGKS